jgi:hypothetical protein
MSGKQNRTNGNGDSENKGEHYQEISTSLYYQEKLQGFYNDFEIEEMRDWLENRVGADNAPYNRE